MALYQLQQIAKRVQEGSDTTWGRLGEVPFFDMLRYNWHLGLTSFGGPSVHFQIFRKRFVEELKWLDQQSFLEMMALCQALPGPASTKMLYGINVKRYGFWVGLCAFFLWSLPMAVAAFGLSLGVAHIGNVLPGPAYALLSGLNSATVGIIALAAYTLSKHAITDTLTRILVSLGACAGMLYNALWYFPVLMVGGALAAIIYDVKPWQYPRRRSVQHDEERRQELTDMPPLPANQSTTAIEPASAASVQGATASGTTTIEQHGHDPLDEETALKSVETFKIGMVIIAVFFASLVIILVVRGRKKNESRSFDLFANLYLAGTIIIGGGPVVVPLLREYVVAPGWVSPRDFLIGLAITQALPGPNFNFAVFLGGLAVRSGPHPLPAIVGAMVGYLAMFAPGLILHTGTIGIWRTVQRQRVVRSTLRGIHAAAVGLIFTAVYRLFSIGYIDENFRQGTTLARDPWWVVILATTFVGGLHFKLTPPYAIVLGSIMGLVWYAVVRR